VWTCVCVYVSACASMSAAQTGLGVLCLNDPSPVHASVHACASTYSSSPTRTLAPPTSSIPQPQPWRPQQLRRPLLCPPSGRVPRGTPPCPAPMALQAPQQQQRCGGGRMRRGSGCGWSRWTTRSFCQVCYGGCFLPCVRAGQVGQEGGIAPRLLYARAAVLMCPAPASWWAARPCAPYA